MWHRLHINVYYVENIFYVIYMKRCVRSVLVQFKQSKKMDLVEIEFHKINGQIFCFYHNLMDITCFFYENEYNLDFWSSKLEHDLDRMDGASIWLKDYYIMKFYADFVTSKNNLDLSLLCDLDFVHIQYYDIEIIEGEESEVVCSFGGDEMWD